MAFQSCCTQRTKVRTSNFAKKVLNKRYHQFFKRQIAHCKKPEYLFNFQKFFFRMKHPLDWLSQSNSQHYRIRILYRSYSMDFKCCMKLHLLLLQKMVEYFLHMNISVPLDISLDSMKYRQVSHEVIDKTGSRPYKRSNEVGEMK
ncbi:Hypothetical_protein [Hexamita inflata]|uniref:Hypothetical_protein n=1 Tax=Hexamita inflata TaxID=28002 RepID=A0ABP1I8U7_9EUKA